MALTEGVITPPLFRLWSGIACVAGALERRVWAKTGPGEIYPNLYVLLVAPPGVGKFVIEVVRNLWQDAAEPGSKIPAFKVGSDSLTNASMMDELAKSRRNMIVPAGPPLQYHSLLIPAEEFEVLVPSYDKQFIASLNSIWNNKSLHKESRRTGNVKELMIEKPQFNILAGAQPAYLANTFPEEAWNTGFCRRLIMIYSSESPLRSIFYTPEHVIGLRERLLRRLSHMSSMYGPVLWHRDAAECLDKWHLASGPPTPTHSKLVHYNRSRSVLVTKLAIISAVSRGDALKLEHIDIERAMAWLLEAEQFMPDVFREMIGKSDKAILDELHMYVMQSYARQKKSPLRTEQIYEFLSARVPSDKVAKLFDVADKGGYITRVGGTTDSWVPRARDQMPGVE